MNDSTKSPRTGKLTGIRLSVIAQELLAGVLRDRYGLRSNTAILETLIREKAREIVATAPRGPLTETISPDEVDEDEADAKRFAGFKAAITRAELDRA